MVRDVELYKSPAGEDGAERMPGRDLSTIPGRYFRTVRDIGERNETSLREVGSWSGRGHADGKEEVTYRARRAVRQGVMLLAVRLHFLDDELHSVEMAAHPEDSDRSNLAFMAEEFFTLFVPVDDAEKVRESEIAAVQERIGTVQARLAAPPRAAVGFLPSPVQKRPTAVDLVQAIDRKENISERAQALVLQAEERLKSLQEGTKEIGALTGLLGRFYQEKATAALALVDDHIQYAREITEGVKTLSLYTGEGVSVKTVCEGEPADPFLPLTLYQDRLYFDEELAVETLTGGFDFTGLERLGDILSRDGSLLDRMVPAKRGAVLLRVRRDGKRYFDAPAMAIADAFMDQMNHKVYLLVRNGENVHLVNSEITTDNADRLFPTAKEIDDIFRLHGREVRPEHLDYSKARSSFEQNTVFYKRMLLMLWGLSDRLNLFGEFYDRGRFSNWYDEAFQRERVTYVHDGEGTLGVDRPSFHEWIEAKNRSMQSGSRIGALWSRMVNPYSAGALYSTRTRDGEPQRLYSPVGTIGIATVERKGDRLVTRCQASGYMRTEYSKTRTFEARIDIVEALRQEPASCICLDAVTVEELDYYLNSRRERRGYRSYFLLFKEIRTLLAAEEAAQKPALDALASDLAHAPLDPARAMDALQRAVALWRAQNGGRIVGGDGWAVKNRTVVLDIAFALAGTQENLIERVRNDIPGTAPIEIRVDGRGTFWLYREPREDEMRDFEKALKPAFVSRVQLRLGKTRISETGTVSRVYLSNPGFVPAEIHRSKIPYSPVREETVSFDPVLKARWEERSLPAWTPFEDVARLADASTLDASSVLGQLSPTFIHDAVYDVMRADRSKFVAHTEFVLPLGFVSFDGKGHTTGCRLLCLAGDGLDVLGALDQPTAERLISRRYKAPGDRLEQLRVTLERTTPGLLPMMVSYVEVQEARQLVDGPAVVNAQSFPVRTVYAASTNALLYMKGKPEPYGSLQEALFETFGRHSEDKPEDLTVVWVEDGNRAVAERYFAEQIKAAKA